MKDNKIIVMLSRLCSAYQHLNKAETLHKDTFRVTRRVGFTLIELLVVVLIIGILSAIALPQYQRAVEKSRLSEALINIKAIQDGFNIFLMENGGYPSTTVPFYNMGTAIELSGGNWVEDGNTYLSYQTKHYKYYAPYCNNKQCYAEIVHLPNYTYTLIINNNQKTCITQLTDLGRFICKSIANQGWNYSDMEV